MIYSYDPLDTACKSIIGAFPCGSNVTFRIKAEFGGEESFSAEICNMVLCKDGENPVVFPMQRTEDGFTLTLRFLRVGLFFYYFRLGEHFLSCGAMRKGVLCDTPWSWQLTVFEKDYHTPQWLKGGVIYQIFPDRFARAGERSVKNKIMRLDWGGTPSFRANQDGKILNNDFFGGNLNGIREKLGYLKELGVTVIYLNPIFEAYSNHRYDTGDYHKIDALLGTTADFDRLVEEADSYGIRLILDGVFNHTGDDSRYFNRYGRYPSEGAYQSKESPYADWYTFHDYPNQYDCWWGIETMPAINEQSPSYQEFMFGKNGVLKKWLRHGIAGYRLDVADELPDFFLKKLRKAVKEQTPDAVIIGEVWEDASNKISYGIRREYFQGAELDSVMNYPLKDAIINYVTTGQSYQLRETVAMLIDNYPKEALDSLMNILGTHDTARILTVLGGRFCYSKEEMAVARLTPYEKQAAIAKLKLAAVLQYTLPGVPSVYYGDENGMEGYRDPFCRGCFDWKNLNEPLIAYYKRLGEIRTKLFPQVFREGIYKEIYSDESFILYERKSREGTVYVYVNNSIREYSISVHGSYTEFISGKQFENCLSVGGYSCGIFAERQ